MCKECQHNEEEEVIEVEVCNCEHHESPMKDMIEMRKKNAKFVLAFDLLAIIVLTLLAVFL